MPSTFRLLAGACNLSLKEAASISGATYSTSRAYWDGTRPNVPPHVLMPLHALNNDIEAQAAAILRAIDKITRRGRLPPGSILLRSRASEQAAAAIGLPTASAHAAVLARVLGRIRPEWLGRVTITENESADDLEILPEKRGRGAD